MPNRNSYSKSHLVGMTPATALLGQDISHPQQHVVEHLVAQPTLSSSSLPNPRVSNGCKKGVTQISSLPPEQQSTDNGFHALPSLA